MCLLLLSNVEVWRLPSNFDIAKDAMPNTSTFLRYGEQGLDLGSRTTGGLAKTLNTPAVTAEIAKPVPNCSGVGNGTPRRTKNCNLRRTGSGFELQL